MHEPLETAELLAFTRTVEARSLSRAAAELGLPRATVSRRLQRMEERLDVRLLRRTTRRLSLTAQGEALYHRARAILDAVGDAERAVRHDEQLVRGRLRVSVPAIMPPGFYALVDEFVAQHPDLRLELLATSRHIDLHAEGYDLALRAGVAASSGLVARILRRERVSCVAAPSYLERHGVPKQMRALADHACILGYTSAELPETHWPLLRGGSVRVEGRVHSNDIFLRRALALAGRGIALLPTGLSAEAVREGALRPVLERVVGAHGQIMLVYPEREFVPPAVRAFIEVAVRWAAGLAELQSCRPEPSQEAGSKMTGPPPARRGGRRALR